MWGVIHLDHNATTCPSDAVCNAVAEAMRQCWHNPSSIHRAGQHAKAKVELARRAVAELIGAKPSEIVFSASGSEAIAMCVRGLVEREDNPVTAVLSSETEHSAMRGCLKSLEGRGLIRWVRLPVDRAGVVSPGAVAEALESLPEGERALVSVQWANNETGVIQPIEAIASVASERGALVHTDGTQWVGKMPADVRTLGVDLLTCAPHKFNGPKGVGIVWIRRGLRLSPLVPGTQELGRRAGTENTPGIIGAGVAAREAAKWLADPENLNRSEALRDKLEQALLERIPGARVNGVGPGAGRGAQGAGTEQDNNHPAPSAQHPAPRVWSTSNMTLPGVLAEALVIVLSERGVMISAGSACGSGSIEPSAALMAMGLCREEAECSIRLSIGKETTEAEIDEAIEKIVTTALEIGAKCGQNATA